MLRSKLVRDKVPALLRAQGTPTLHGVRRLPDHEYFEALGDKLLEEVREFFEAPFSLDELADVLEVVQAIARVLATPEDLEEARRAKAELRGGFDGRLFMTWEAS